MVWGVNHLSGKVAQVELRRQDRSSLYRKCPICYLHIMSESPECFATQHCAGRVPAKHGNIQGLRAIRSFCCWYNTFEDFSDYARNGPFLGS
jgi:hypothetical protein